MACVMCSRLFCFKQKTAYEMRISDWSFRRVLFRSGLFWLDLWRGKVCVAQAAVEGGLRDAATGVMLVRRSTMRSQRMRPVIERKFLPSMAALLAFEAVGRLGGIRRAAKELMIDHAVVRSEEHTSELQSLMRISY